VLDYPSEARRLEIAREQAQYDALQAELRQEAEVVVVDVKKAELLSQKVLATHSVRLKIAFSELVVQTVEDLRSSDVRPKDRALALGALRGICDRLYGWDREADIAQMERVSNHPLSNAINLELISCSPQQLRELHEPKMTRMDREQDGQGDGKGVPASLEKVLEQKEDLSKKSSEGDQPVPRWAETFERAGIPWREDREAGEPTGRERGVKGVAFQNTALDHQEAPKSPAERRRLELERIAGEREKLRSERQRR
jgi:hypothetical protein